MEPNACIDQIPVIRGSFRRHQGVENWLLIVVNVTLQGAGNQDRTLPVAIPLHGRELPQLQISKGLPFSPFFRRDFPAIEDTVKPVDRRRGNGNGEAVDLHELSSRADMGKPRPASSASIRRSTIAMNATRPFTPSSSRRRSMRSRSSGRSDRQYRAVKFGDRPVTILVLIFFALSVLQPVVR